MLRFSVFFWLCILANATHISYPMKGYAITRFLGGDAALCDQDQFDLCMGYYTQDIGLVDGFPSDPSLFAAWVTKADSTVEGMFNFCKSTRALMFCLGAQTNACFSVQNLVAQGMTPSVAGFYNILYLHLQYECGIGLTTMLRNHACIQQALIENAAIVQQCQANFSQLYSFSPAQICTAFQAFLDCQSDIFSMCNTETDDVMCQSFLAPLSSSVPMCRLKCTTCTPVFDVVYIVDESESVGSDGFDQIKSFLVNLTDGFSQGSDENIRVSMVWFSQSCGVEFFLNTYNTTNAVDQAINRAENHLGATNIFCALDLTMKTVLIPGAGDRSNIPNLIFIMTDGGWNVGQNPVPIAQSMRAQGNEIWVIAPFPDASNDTLIGLTGDPNHILGLFTDYSALSSVVKQTLSKFTCHS